MLPNTSGMLGAGRKEVFLNFVLGALSIFECRGDGPPIVAASNPCWPPGLADCFCQKDIAPAEVWGLCARTLDKHIPTRAVHLLAANAATQLHAKTRPTLNACKGTAAPTPAYRTIRRIWFWLPGRAQNSKQAPRKPTQRTIDTPDVAEDVDVHPALMPKRASETQLENHTHTRTHTSRTICSATKLHVELR